MQLPKITVLHLRRPSGFLHEDIRADVCNIYGFVRFADEIVDTFHNYNKEELLRSFEKET